MSSHAQPSNSSSTDPKPTLLFVHGSWHQPAHFDSLRKLCEKEGFTTLCPAQPSTGADPETSADVFAKDVAVIRDAAYNLVETGKDVIVIGHSYGGVLISEAIHESFGKQARSVKGEKGGVIHLVYLCAFVIPVGESLASALGGTLPPYITLREDGNCWMEEPEHRFYNDLTPKESKKYIDLLKTVPTSTQFAKTSYAAYKHFPCTYLYCNNDQGLPVQVQRMMVEGNGGQTFRTQTCDAGHSPYLSKPEVVVNILKNTAKI